MEGIEGTLLREGNTQLFILKFNCTILYDIEHCLSSLACMLRTNAISPAVLLGELLAHAAVDLVEDVALAPGRPAAVDELVEEHAVQEPREEGGGVLHAAPRRAPQPEEGRLVEADEGLGVDSDKGETRSVTLQYKWKH